MERPKVRLDNPLSTLINGYESSNNEFPCFIDNKFISYNELFTDLIK
ncbi:14492_t:CDS:2 [Rhizophagus irregularis]|nr:14492_t:CDS:2 [Rhizophagus irregularis]